MGGFATFSDEIADSWLSSAIGYAQARGYTFDPSCQADLTTFFNNAAAQLRASGAEAGAASHNQNVQLLVQFMIEELNTQSPEARVLHEWTLANARIRFCPLFPFC
jgi:hypothetical protein